MAPVLSSLPKPANPLSPETASRRKFRIRFRKTGELRFLSHHDLMHVFERMFRRADLTLCVSQGFNPRPRMAFGLSLALGVAGLNEILEIETAQPLEADDVAERLARQCPAGIAVIGVREIDVRASARVRRAFYRVECGNIADLTDRCNNLMASTERWIARARPHPRRVNVRPFIDVLDIGGDFLTMALWITPTGAARPEEVLAALDLKYLLDAGTVIERTDLESIDELPPGTPDAPAIHGALRELDPNEAESPVEAPRPTPIMDNPLSFET